DIYTKVILLEQGRINLGPTRCAVAPMAFVHRGGRKAMLDLYRNLSWIPRCSEGVCSSVPKTEIINHRQMAWMVSAIIVGAGMISSHNELIRICRMDAWFSYALPVIYAFL